MSIRYTEFDFSHSLVAGSMSSLVPPGTLSCTTNIFIFLPTSPPIPPNQGSRARKCDRVGHRGTNCGFARGNQVSFFWTKTGRLYGGGISSTEESKHKDPEAGVHLLCLGSSMEDHVVETVS